MTQRSARDELTLVLSAGACLLESADADSPTPDLCSALRARLSKYYACSSLEQPIDESLSLQELQTLTAKEALSVVKKVQHMVSDDNSDEQGCSSDVPAIGTRDLSQLRTLLSVVFNWGVEPLFISVVRAWPTKISPSATITETKFIEVPASVSNDFQLLSQFISDIFMLLFPKGIGSRLPQTLITTTILNRYTINIIRTSLGLGWMPKSLSSGSISPVDKIRPLTMRLLAILPPSQTIASLGAVLSSPTVLPLHAYRACASLLSRQLLRPDGVRGLCEAVFGEDEDFGGDALLEKLEHIAHVIITVPSSMKPTDYFQTIVPRLIRLLSDQDKPIYRRTAAFVLYQMLMSAKSLFHASAIVFAYLHEPFLKVASENSAESSANSAVSQTDLLPSDALSALVALISNADPSPKFISDLLSPIFPALYSLLYCMDKKKASDPTLAESLRGILLTWGKIIATTEGFDTLWSIVCNGEGGEWAVDLDGQFCRIKLADQLPSLSLLTPKDMTAGEDPDMDANLFDLYPDPNHFVLFLKSIDRGDISAAIFVKLLEMYRAEKSQPSNQPMRTLLQLQIILQMQKQLSEGTTSNILRQPKQMLLFIDHVLASSTPALDEVSRTRGANRFNMLGEEAEEDMVDISDEPDSDDDMPDSERIGPDDEMIETSLNLLLSILEADEDLSARTEPILNDIFSHLEPMTREGSSSIRPLSREARLVITARLASTSSETKKPNRSQQEESAQEIYQKALKLLQDPILPVRAHGLLLLRQLVSPTEPGSKPVDPALSPAILSIFLQSIQDEDSYIFLNAVQGLAAMVDTFGREVLKGLLSDYCGGLGEIGASPLTQQDVDVRTRIGEALGAVIKRCGDTLGIYVNILIPPLFNVVRAREVPVVLRTSSLSLLADCVNTCLLAVLPYIEDLAAAMIDLLQIESVQAAVPSATQDAQHQGIGGENSVDLATSANTLDSQPTSLDSKVPPLRRSALHFLSLMIRQVTQYVYDSQSSSSFFFSVQFIKRAKVTLGYVASTDGDNIVRIMAREAGESVNELQHALLGI